MVQLGVNLDHVATLRQARLLKFPDPLEAALLVQRAGADGITLHLRDDRRHIQDLDVIRIRKKVRLPLNLEMAATDEMVDFARRIKPDEICLVPEKRRELTTEGGLDMVSLKGSLTKKIGTLKKSGIRVSIFVDPDPAQILSVKEAGADCAEIHTGRYAGAQSGEGRVRELEEIFLAGKKARGLGLILHAGHGLDYDNVRPVARIPGMEVLNIGFSIVSRALFVGLERAVREMIAHLKV